MNHQIHAALKQAREHHNLEQHELAALLGVKKCMVSKVERGVRSLSATEFLTLGLIFPSWLEVDARELVTDLRADLAARLREYLADQSFGPLAYAKRDWLKARLRELDGEDAIIA